MLNSPWNVWPTWINKLVFQGQFWWSGIFLETTITSCHMSSSVDMHVPWRYPCSIVPWKYIHCCNRKMPSGPLVRVAHFLTFNSIQESGTKSNGHPNYSAHWAAQDFGIPQSSLGFHLQGMYYFLRWFCVTECVLGGKTCQEEHVDEQTLTEAQEEILVKWIKTQNCQGVPMTYASVGQCATAILGWYIGGSWLKQFSKYHPDLKMKKTTGLEKAHAKALNQFAVNEFLTCWLSWSKNMVFYLGISTIWTKKVFS